MKPLKPAQIRAIRKKWGASQTIFADILNVPKKTYISWESGYKNPSGAALKLLMIAKEKPESPLGYLSASTRKTQPGRLAPCKDLADHFA